MLKKYVKRKKINEKYIIVGDSNYFNLYFKNEGKNRNVKFLFSQKILKYFFFKFHVKNIISKYCKS